MTTILMVENFQKAHPDKSLANAPRQSLQLQVAVEKGVLVEEEQHLWRLAVVLLQRMMTERGEAGWERAQQVCAGVRGKAGHERKLTKLRAPHITTTTKMVHLFSFTFMIYQFTPQSEQK
jgi:redox-regulated HSP33 family molecular chaperone